LEDEEDRVTMNAMAVGALMTADEYLRLPYDGRRTQLIDGEVVLTAAKLLHELVCSELHFALQVWRRAEPGRGLAVRPIDVKLNERNVYNPDILWYAEDRVPARDDQPPYPMPNLAIEVRSESTWHYDVGVKRRIYEEKGLPELWLVDTRAQAVRSFRRSRPKAKAFDVVLEVERDERPTSPQLPGFSLALSELFAEPT
jgi:Uma2 family endonuclease